jgi:hypothetical protein
VSWRVVLLAGTVLAIAMGLVGLVLDRSEVGVSEPIGVHYVDQWPTPFERQVYLGDDKRALLEKGDSELWYFGAGAMAGLTLASLPLLIERERRRARRAVADGAAPGGTAPPRGPTSSST